MECGNCRHQNEPTSKFCGECGSPLLSRCPSCGVQQAPNLKFCTQCGTSMSGHAPASPPAVTPSAGSAERPAAVRKDVTALFADLVGSTAFGEQVDPEAARSALAPYFEILRSGIEDHAGTVAKFTGDGVMAVFGIPEIAEDDALRAVAAGAELQRRFRAFADSVRDRHGVELGLRVGINTGELVIGDDDADLVGDVLNTAARLEAACQPGRVLVGEDTWRLTRSSVTYEVLGEVRVKGKTDAIATFQVVDDDRGTAEDATPFVGRDDELTLLLDAFEQARSSPAAKLVTVIGAPGVGKTRLAAELRAAVDARSFDLRFERRGSTTFTPIAELLRELTGSGSTDDVARLVADHPESERLAGALSAFLGHGEARSTEESFWAVRRLLEHLSADEPLVIVVDDIQWAEPLFWDLLDHLVEWAAAPVLLLALARPELRELKPELTQPGRRVVASISLEGLDASTTRELAARLLDTDELPGDLIDRLPASTEGNPLFIRELVQMLVDDGVLARSGDSWHLTIDVEAIEVPPTVLSLLASRVERLPDDERQVVELASVIGTEFDRGVLGSIAGDEVASRLGALIDRLRRKDLIEPSGTWAGDQPVYRFHHVLVRDAAYRRLLKAHRADLHEQVGRFLETSGGPADELDITIAHHYELVHRYRTELGTVDDATADLAAQAAGRLRSAAELALGREDLVSAGGFAARAIGLSADPAQLHELLLLGCEALLSSGDVTRGAPLVDQLQQQAGDERLASWADCFRAELWSLTDADRLSEAADLSDAAANRLATLGDNAGVAKARLVRAATLARLGRVGDCEVELDLALGAARAAGDRRRTVAVLGAAPRAALFGPSPVARAGGRCLDVLRLLRITTSSQAVEATSIRCQGMLEALRGRFDSARDKFEVSRTTATELGHRQGLCETELFHGFAELLAGDAVAAEPHLRAARDGLGRLGIGADAGQASALLARSLLSQGRIDEAEELAREAVESAGQNLRTAIGSRSVLAEIMAERGDFDDANRLIAEATGLVEGTDVLLEHAQTMLAAARVARAAGDLAAMGAAAATAAELLDAKGVTARLDGTEVGVDQESEAQVDEQQPPASGQTGNRAWQLYSAMIDDWRAANDQGALISHLRHDFATVNHERLRPDEAPRDRVFLAGLFTWAASFDNFDVQTEIVETSGDHLFMARWTITIDGEVIERRLIVETDDNHIVRYDSYELDDEAGAQVEFERRTTGSRLRDRQAEGDAAPAANRAFRAALELQDAMLAQDRDAAELVFHPDVLVEIHSTLWASGGEPIALDRDTWLDRILLDSDVSETGSSSRLELIDTRGDGLCLYRAVLTSRDGHLTEGFFVDQLAQGLVTFGAVFDDEQFDEATAELERLWTEAGSIDFDTPVVRGGFVLLDAWNAGDLPRVRACMAADLEIQSHRTVVTPGHTYGEEAQDALLALHEVAPSLVSTPLEVRGEHLLLSRQAWTDQASMDIEMLAIMQIGPDHRIRRAATFDPDDRAGAEALLDAWASEPPPANLERLRRFGNDASWEWVYGLRARAASALANGSTNPTRLGWVDDRMADEIELTDHGGTQAHAIGRERVWAAWGELVDAGFERTHGTVIAERGERFVLSSETLTSRNAVIERLTLIETDSDGRLVRVDVFELDQESDAHEMLDDRWFRCDDDRMNKASELVRDFGISLRSVGPEAAMELIDPDAVIEFRMHLAGGRTMTREEFVDNQVAVADQGLTTTTRVRAVAGPNLALMSASFADDETESARWAVVQSDGDQIIAVISLDDDQLPDARPELYRRWAETGGPSTYIDVRLRIGAALAAGDLAAARACFHPGFSSQDFRPLGMGTRDIDGWLHSIADVVGPASGGHSMPIEAIDFTETALLYHHTVDIPTDLGAPVWDVLALVVMVDGRIKHWDHYDLDQLTEARARFRELTTRTNTGDVPTGWAAVEAVHEALVAGRTDRLVDLFAPGFAGISRERLSFQERTLDRDGWVEALAVFTREGEITNASIERVAERASTLFLTRTRADVDGNSVELFFLDQVVDGQITSSVIFGSDQLDEALDQLDRRWVELGGSAEFAEAHGRFRHVLARGAVDDLQEVIADDFVAVDHRALGLATRNRDSWIESVGEFVGRSTTITSRCLIDGNVELGSGSFVLDDGSVLVDGPAVIVINERRQFSRMELFEPDQEDLAHDRFDELVAESATHNRAPLENTATRIGDAVLSACEAQDRDALEQLIHDDFESDWRFTADAAIGAEIGDKQQYIDLAVNMPDSFTDPDAGLSASRRVLAVRGDHLYLGRGKVVVNGYDWEYLVLAESEEGRYRRLIWWEPDRVSEAFVELDRRWFESLGWDENHVMWRAVPLQYTNDWSAIDPELAGLILNDAVEFTDHRRVGFPAGGRDEIGQIIDTFDSSLHIEVPRYQRLSARAAVVDRCYTWGGEPWETSTITVASFDEHNFRSVEIYDWDDLDSAFVRFDELNARADPGPAGLTNASAEAVRRLEVGWNAGELDVDADYEPDYVFAGRRASAPAVDGGRDVVTEMFTFWQQSGATLEMEVLAVRGERFCMYVGTLVTADQDRFEIVMIDELSESGRFARTNAYDVSQLSEANAELNRWYLESLGYGPDHFLTGLNTTEYRPDRLGPVLHDDWVYVDHRNLGWPSVDKPTYLSGQLASVPKSMAWIELELIRLSEQGIVQRQCLRSVDGDTKIEAIGVHVVQDEQIVRTEVFEVDDVDGAMARFHELTGGEPVDSGAISPSLSNGAWEVTSASLEAFAQGDWDRVDQLTHPDFVQESRRPTSASAGASGFERDDQMASLKSWHELGGAITEQPELLAIRGGSLCLFRSVTTIGDEEVPYVAIIETAGSQMLRLTTYDPGQLDDALDDLDRRWADLGGPAWWVAVTIKYRRAISRGNGQADIRAFAADGFVAVDHQAGVSLGERTADEWAASIEPLQRRCQIVLPQIVAWSDVGVSLQSSHVTMPDGSTWHDWRVISSSPDPADESRRLFTRWETFGLADHERALARYRKLVTELESPQAAVESLANGASRLARFVAEAWERRDAVATRSALSPDFQLASRKKQRVGITVDRDGFVGLVESTTTNPDGLVSTHRVIQVRGDHLALFETTDTYGDDVVRQLSVIEVVDGLLRTLTLFDLDQLDEAMALLEARWDDREDLRNEIPEPD